MYKTVPNWMYRIFRCFFFYFFILSVDKKERKRFASFSLRSYNFCCDFIVYQILRHCLHLWFCCYLFFVSLLFCCKFSAITFSCYFICRFYFFFFFGLRILWFSFTFKENRYIHAVPILCQLYDSRWLDNSYEIHFGAFVLCVFISLCRKYIRATSTDGFWLHLCNVCCCCCCWSFYLLKL